MFPDYCSEMDKRTKRAQPGEQVPVVNNDEIPPAGVHKITFNTKLCHFQPQFVLNEAVLNETMKKLIADPIIGDEVKACLEAADGKFSYRVSIIALTASNYHTSLFINNCILAQLTVCVYVFSNNTDTEPAVAERLPGEQAPAVVREKVWTTFHTMLGRHLGGLAALTAIRPAASLLALHAMKWLVAANYTPTNTNACRPEPLANKEEEILVYIAGYLFTKSNDIKVQTPRHQVSSVLNRGKKGGLSSQPKRASISSIITHNARLNESSSTKISPQFEPPLLQKPASCEKRTEYRIHGKRS